MIILIISNGLFHSSKKNCMIYRRNSTIIKICAQIVKNLWNIELIETCLNAQSCSDFLVTPTGLSLCEPPLYPSNWTPYSRPFYRHWPHSKRNRTELLQKLLARGLCLRLMLSNFRLNVAYRVLQGHTTKCITIYRFFNKGRKLFELKKSSVRFLYYWIYV